MFFGLLIVKERHNNMIVNIGANPLKNRLNIAVLISLLLLSGCSANANSNLSSDVTIGEVLSSSESNQFPDETTAVDNNITTENENSHSTPSDAIEPSKRDIKKGEVSVDIILPDSGNLETRNGSSSDVNLNRPSSLKGNEVFDGWTQEEVVSQIKDGSVKPDESLTLTAKSIDIGNMENVIYNDVTYVNAGKDSVSIPVTVGGNTNFAILELEISYDTSLLEFDSFLHKDSDVECNCPEAGLICISFVSMDNANADIELCDILFKNISTQSSETALKYNIKDLAAWNADKTDYVDVNHEVINGKIVMF